MNHEHTRLRSFNELLTDAFKFLRTHWIDLLYALLPVFICLLVLSFIEILYNDVLPVTLVFVFAMLIFVFRLFRNIIIIAGGMLCDDVENTHHRIDPFVWYKKLWVHTPSILLLMLMTTCLALAFFVATVVAGLALLLLPFIIISLFAKASPVFLDLLSLQGSSITVGLVCVIGLAIIALNVWFAVGIWSASYALLLEGRKGLHALTSSFLYIRGRRFAFIWRFLVLSLIALVPIILLVGPVYVYILIDFVKQLALGLFLFGSLSITPVTPLSLMLAEAGLGFVALIVSIPLFMTFNYFLWKDIKSTAYSWDEGRYHKTRKWIRAGVYAGAVLVVICILLSVISMVFSPRSTYHSSSFGNIPASGMMSY